MASKLGQPAFSSSARVPGLTRYVRAAILLFLLVWVIVSLVHDARLLVRSYSPLPFWDDWRVIQNFQAYKHHQLSVFFQQQNEHRIVFPELIFALDDLLFHGRRLLTISSSCFFYLGTWWLLGSSLLSTRAGSRFASWCAILVAGILLAWPASTLVLGTPFQLQWILEGFALAGALVFTAKTGASRSAIHLAIAIAFAVIATFSSANGLFIWPVLLAAGFLLRLGKRRISALGISAIASIALFFTDYTFSPQSNLGLLFRHPLLFIGFVSTYMGVPFSPVSEWVGILVGLASIVAFACLVVAAWRQNLLRSQPGVVLCGFYLLILFTAAMTAIGRMDPKSSSLFGAAMAHRYLVVPLEGWAALAMIVAWIMGTSKRQLWAVPLAVLLVGLFLEDQSRDIKTWMQNPRVTFFTSSQIASLSLESGLQDSGIIGTVFPSVEEVRRLLPVMRQYRLSTFYRGRQAWIGKPATSVFPSIYPSPAAGAITVAYPIESGLELMGWTDSLRKIWHPEQLIFLNGKQQIVGFGSKIPEEFPWGLGSLNTPSLLAWVGFVNLGVPSSSVRAYTIERNGKLLVAVGEPLSLESISQAKSITPQMLGPLLPALDWQMRGAWQKNGNLPAEPKGDRPPGGYFESWVGNDSNTGELTSAVFDLPNACIVVPVAHGPSINHLQVNLVDANSLAILASVPMLGSDASWRYWQLRIPGAISRARIIAEDQGHDWGEWLAIGQPHSCRQP